MADPNKHRFNHYADKQLAHLVVAEEFDFGKIANTLSTAADSCRLYLQGGEDQVQRDDLSGAMGGVAYFKIVGGGSEGEKDGG
jgi:hypothetical protein